MGSLDGKVAIVTGASRGIGKGIALGLGEAGATVYVTGRTTEPGTIPGTIGVTAARVIELAGLGVAVRCDHSDDKQVAALFAQVTREQGRIDILVNNAFATPDLRVLWGGKPFWEIPSHLWDDMLAVGLRSHFVAARYAVPPMIAQGGGLIVNVASSSATTPKSPKSRVVLPYSVGKAALHRLTSDMAVELADRGVSVIEIWPPASVIEAVAASPGMFGDLSSWREPVFTGRVLAALVAAGNWMARSGQTFIIEDAAKELGVTP